MQLPSASRRARDDALARRAAVRRGLRASSRCPTRARSSGTSRTRAGSSRPSCSRRIGPATACSIRRSACSSTRTTTRSATSIRGRSAACCRGPSLDEVRAYRAHVDARDGALFARGGQPRLRAQRSDRARPQARAAAPGADPHRHQAPALAQPAAGPPIAGRWPRRRGRARTCALGRASTSGSTEIGHDGARLRLRQRDAAPSRVRRTRSRSRRAR